MLLFEIILKLGVHKQSLKVVSTLIQHEKSRRKKKLGKIWKTQKTS